MTLFILWILCAFGAATLGATRNKTLLGFVLGFLFGIIGLFIMWGIVLTTKPPQRRRRRRATPLPRGPITKRNRARSRFR